MIPVKPNTPVLILIVSALFLSSCGGSGGGSSDDDETAPSQSSVGRKIFFDQDLSSNGNQSCGSCHDPAAGFADPSVTAVAPVSQGSVPGRFGNRNAPTAAYAASIPAFVKVATTTVDGTVSNYQGGQFLDGRRDTLADQARDPFLNPVEMNNADEATVVNKVLNAAYANEFKEVFGANVFNDVAQAYDNIASAIAAFESTSEVNSFTSKFDAVMAGMPGVAFTASEQRGFELFIGTGPRDAKCANCHTVNSPSAAGSLFTNFNYYNVGTPANPANPVYGITPGFVDQGLGNTVPVAEQAAERGKFRTPTLRNVELTPPYMHNGVFTTLEDVVQHYDIDIANEFSTPEVSDNIANELDAGGFVGLGLAAPGDYEDLRDFMLTLTDGYF